MNPNYHPLNPSPFAQPQGSYATGSVNGASGPAIPNHSSPYYSMHPSYPPAPHGYAPYYPQQMMMYPAPRPGASMPEQPQPSSTSSPAQAPSSIAIGKRKRKPDSARGTTVADKDSDQEGPSGSDVPAKPSTPTAAALAASDSKKRTKTQRACDSCRSRKIRYGWIVRSFASLSNLFLFPFRCDVLPESDPPLCQHCKQYGFECTFFLPITETRFKKKKLEEEAAEKEKEKSADPRRNTSSPQVDAGELSVFGSL